MKVYTKTGDCGTTSLIGNKRVRKNDPRIEVYGTLDELDSFVGLLKNLPEAFTYRETLTSIQKDIATLNTVFAADEQHKTLFGIGSERTLWLEREIDAISAKLPPITEFLIPGNGYANALCNVCRTVCRRAERRVYDLELTPAQATAACYINRLSDFLFVLGRELAEND